MWTVTLNDSDVDVSSLTVTNPDKIAYVYFTSVNIDVHAQAGTNTFKFVSKGGAATNFSGIIVSSVDSSLTLTK